jgi:hypothetical protein
MDEQASFEARAVLPPRRARRSRLAVVVPALALAGVALAGYAGGRSDQDAKPTDAVAAVLPSPTTAPPVQAVPYPAEVIGLGVHGLVDVQAQGLGRDRPVAIAGWYVATAITDCPLLDAFYRAGALPEVRHDIATVDSWAFCRRTGVLYASRASYPVSAVTATLVTGVVVPPAMEKIGAAATQVVVVAHFVPSDGCRGPRCVTQLLVDYLGWSAGAGAADFIDSSPTTAPGQPRLPADGTNVITGG